MNRIYHLLWHSLGILLYFPEFIRTLVYGQDLWIFHEAILLFYIVIAYYFIYLFITFAKQLWGEKRFFLFERHRLPPSILTGNPFYVQYFFYCSAIVSSPLYSFINILAVRVIACRTFSNWTIIWTSRFSIEWFVSSIKCLSILQDIFYFWCKIYNFPFVA